MSLISQRNRNSWNADHEFKDDHMQTLVSQKKLYRKKNSETSARKEDSAKMNWFGNRNIHITKFKFKVLLPCKLYSLWHITTTNTNEDNNSVYTNSGILQFSFEKATLAFVILQWRLKNYSLFFWGKPSLSWTFRLKHGEKKANSINPSLSIYLCFSYIGN